VRASKMAKKGKKDKRADKLLGVNTKKVTEDLEETRKTIRVYWRFFFIAFAIIMIFTSGIVGFMVFENLPLDKAVHLTMQTITTVGYGDIEIETTEGRILSDVLMVFGLVIATFGVASLLEFIVSGKLREAMRTRDYEGMIGRMKNHVIVCGYGRVGRAAVEELRKEKVPVVVLDKVKEAVEELDLDVPRIIGDVTQDEELLRCNIKKAVALIATAGNDADNLMAVVTAKYIKPEIIAITRSSVEEDKEKFLKVGADMVVSPEMEGGKSMAKMLAEAKDLVIVAGFGRVGNSCARELHSLGIKLIVMEKDPAIVDEIPKYIDHMEGDVTKEGDLIKAKVDKAMALVSACGKDAHNLLATVTAKYYKPSITVISRAGSPEDVGKILKVGADVVISPEVEGGKSMAKWAAQASRLSAES
jgi:voltage-gated potassium channel